MKKWNILPPPPADFIQLHSDLSPIVTRLLWNRNLRDDKQIKEFLNPDYTTDVHDPFLFNDMEKALAIIFDAIDKQKKIVVHGDYDADGVCASAVLISTLKKFGANNVGVFIPHREMDGYGLNTNSINEFKKQNVDLIITCDCGVSNVEEVRLANQLGMRVIITDHHSIPAITPPAEAIIHPKMPNENYPDKGLCGTAVAFKLVQGMLKKHSENHNKLPDGSKHEAFEKWMLDLVAVASIAHAHQIRPDGFK